MLSSLADEDGKDFFVKQAPSSDWQEVCDMWQCHEESYEKFYDPDTKTIKVSKKHCLIDGNMMLFCQEYKDLMPTFDCPQCKATLGLRSSGKITAFYLSRIKPFS